MQLLLLLLLFYYYYYYHYYSLPGTDFQQLISDPYTGIGSGRAARLGHTFQCNNYHHYHYYYHYQSSKNWPPTVHLRPICGRREWQDYQAGSRLSMQLLSSSSLSGWITPFNAIIIIIIIRLDHAFQCNYYHHHYQAGSRLSMQLLSSSLSGWITPFNAIIIIIIIISQTRTDLQQFISDPYAGVASWRAVWLDHAFDAIITIINIIITTIISTATIIIIIITSLPRTDLQQFISDLYAGVASRRAVWLDHAFDAIITIINIIITTIISTATIIIIIITSLPRTDLQQFISDPYADVASWRADWNTPLMQLLLLSISSLLLLFLLLLLLLSLLLVFQELTSNSSSPTRMRASRAAGLSGWMPATKTLMVLRSLLPARLRPIPLFPRENSMTSSCPPRSPYLRCSLSVEQVDAEKYTPVQVKLSLRELLFVGYVFFSFVLT